MAEHWAAEQHQFISHVTEDKEIVDQLELDLRRAGLAPWVSRSRMAPAGGLRWRDVVRDAIRGGHAFIACFSSAAARREKSYMREEVRVAIDELSLRPRDRAWFIPVRLDECEIPKEPIGLGETLDDVHRIDLFPDWTRGVQQIVASLSLPDEAEVRWIHESLRIYASESTDDRARWRYLLQHAANTGYCKVRVVDRNHEVAQRLCRLGALEDLEWRHSWHRFGVTERGRVLHSELASR